MREANPGHAAGIERSSTLLHRNEFPKRWQNEFPAPSERVSLQMLHRNEFPCRAAQGTRSDALQVQPAGNSFRRTSSSACREQVQPMEHREQIQPVGNKFSLQGTSYQPAGNKLSACREQVQPAGNKFSLQGIRFDALPLQGTSSAYGAGQLVPTHFNRKTGYDPSRHGMLMTRDQLR